MITNDQSAIVDVLAIYLRIIKVIKLSVIYKAFIYNNEY